MKPYKNLRTFKEAWTIVSTLQDHTIKALRQTKKEVSSHSFQLMKKKIIETYTKSIERINKI
jgi:hypothetical protein